MDCISHLLSRCLAILIAPSERLRSDVIKTFMALPVVLVRKAHLICHTRNSLSNFLIHSECPLLRGGEGLLLTQGDKVIYAWDLDWFAHKLCALKNYSSFASLWLSTHLCTHLVTRLFQDKLSQDMLSPAEKAQRYALLMLHLYLPVLSLLKTFPLRDKLVKR